MESTPPPLVVKKEMVTVTPDESLRTCDDRPAYRKLTDDNAVAELIAELFTYGDDCKSKHDATWKSIDEAKKKAAEFNAQQP